MTTARRFLVPLCGIAIVLGGVAGGATPALAALAPCPNILTEGHVDGFAVGFDGDAWTLVVEDDENERTLPPEEALLWVDDAARAPRPLGAQWNFLGVGAGSPVWTLPQTPNPALLFIGTNALDVEAFYIAPYVESDSRVSHAELPWVRLQVQAVRGPGHFSAWQTDSFGQPRVFVATAQGGLTLDDALFLLPGGHVHYNWGFSARGIYEVDVRATAYLGPDQTDPTASAVTTFYFGVDHGLPGDAGRAETGNGAQVDGVVTLDDYLIWLSNYGATNASWRMGDFNANGRVGPGDYTLWSDNLGRCAANSAVPATVPEPATAWLMLGGALLVGVPMWRGRRSFVHS